MIFQETPLQGAFVIDLEPMCDERGFFARTWCVDEFAKYGLETELSQCSVSFNKEAATLRGMHYQRPPHGEAKVVSCRAGKFYDVIIDLRPESTTYCRWFGIELSKDNRRALYIPAGMAHGFITLVPATEVYYQIAGRFVPAYAEGVRWDDRRFGIDWPLQPKIIAERDARYPDFPDFLA